ncbi:MAG: beta-ketoacyl-ACP synthase 3 [Propionibacteriaceae bacterium]|nr:beta-ketoacyl-ACP synthase 3 [Propionibacteriaceae bacterium]
MTIKITGTGIGLPKHHVTNEELAEVTGLDTSDEWISTMTGIKARYICDEETITDLATTAAINALADAGTAATDIDYILCATIGGDTRTPALACAVAERIGVECAAADLSGACTGFLYALDLISCMIQTGRASTVLLICAEKMSAHLDFTDRNTCVLFGDGAAAVVVTPGSALKYIHVTSHPDTQVLSLANRMTGNSPFTHHRDEVGFVHMEGQKVFRYAVTYMEREVIKALATLGLEPDDVDYYLVHQANRRIIESAISRLDLSPDKFPMNIDRYGNMSSVSIPVLLHEQLAAGTIKPGDTLVMCAFGAGMTYGSCVVEWE